MKSLLESGLFFDALLLSTTASNKDIIDKILVLREQYKDNFEFLELLQIAQENLTAQRELYQNTILPCIDFVYAFIENKYGRNIREGIIQHALLRFETVKKYFEQKNIGEDSLGRLNELFIKEILNRDNPSLDAYLKTLGLSKIALIDILLLQEGVEDLSYAYYDCECDNSGRTSQKALELAFEELETLTDDYNLLGSLGFSFLKLARHEEALKCFIKQNEINKEDGVVWNNMAWCYMKLGNYSKAFVHCEKAIKLLPDHSHVHHDYASILFGLNRFDEAILTIKGAISNLNPPAAQLFYLLASIIEKKGIREYVPYYWKLYLSMVQNKPGHRRVVEKVREKLTKERIKIDVKENNKGTTYPVRIIADEIYNKDFNKIAMTIEKVKTNSTKFNTSIFAQDKYRMTRDARQTEIDRQCEQLFYRTLENLKQMPFLDTFLVQDQFNKWLLEKEKNNIPYWVLIRDVIQKLIEDIFDNYMTYLRIYPIYKEELSDIRLAVAAIVNNIIVEELLNEINTLGINNPISTLQWMYSVAGNLNLNQTVEANIIDLPAMLYDQSILMNQKIVLENEIIEFDYTSVWFNNYLNHVTEKRVTLGTEITLEKSEINSYKKELSKKEAENQKDQKDLKDRKATIEKYIRQTKKVTGLLHSAETLINSVQHIHTINGFKAWLLGYKRKITRILSSLKQISHQINSINLHHLKITNLDKLSIRDVPVYIQSVFKKESLEKISSLENSLVSLQKEKDEVISKQNSSKVEFKNLKREINDQIVKLKNKIKNNNQKIEIIGGLIERGNFLKNKWPIILYSKHKNLSEISTFFDDSGEIIIGEMEESHIFLYNIEKKALSEIPNYYHKNFYKVFKLFKDYENIFILCYHSDDKIYLRNFSNNSPLSEFNIYDDITCLFFINSTLFVGTYGMIYIIDIHSSQLKYCLIGNEGKVLSLAVDSKNGLLYSGDIYSDNPLFSQVCVWDLKLVNKKEALVRRLTGFKGGVLSLILTPNGKFLVAGEGVGDSSSPEPSKIIIWDTEELRVERILEGHKGWVKSLAVVCIGNKVWLVSGDAVGSIEHQQDSDIYIWDIQSWELVTIIKGHKGWVNSINSSSDGKFLISGGIEEIYIWDMIKVLNKAK